MNSEFAILRNANDTLTHALRPLARSRRGEEGVIHAPSIFDVEVIFRDADARVLSEGQAERLVEAGEEVELAVRVDFTVRDGLLRNRIGWKVQAEAEKCGFFLGAVVEAGDSRFFVLCQRAPVAAPVRRGKRVAAAV